MIGDFCRSDFGRITGGESLADRGGFWRCAVKMAVRFMVRIMCGTSPIATTRPSLRTRSLLGVGLEITQGVASNAPAVATRHGWQPFLVECLLTLAGATLGREEEYHKE